MKRLIVIGILLPFLNSCGIFDRTLLPNDRLLRICSAQTEIRIQQDLALLEALRTFPTSTTYNRAIALYISCPIQGFSQAECEICEKAKIDFVYGVNQ